MTKTPSGGRAVVEQRAPQTVEADDPVRARWRQLDWFATPPFAARAGGELIRAIDPAARSIWDPACGDGIMAECFEEFFPETHASDIHDHGYGWIGDFLAPSTFPNGRFEAPSWIATNPPFNVAADFVRRGLQIATSGVAMLCRLAFLETVDRYALHFGDHPLYALAPFSERVPMQLGPWNPKCSTATVYAWFVWRSDRSRDARPVIIPIAPGTRSRLSYPDDVRHFIKSAHGSLI